MSDGDVLSCAIHPSGLSLDPNLAWISSVNLENCLPRLLFLLSVPPIRVQRVLTCLARTSFCLRFIWEISSSPDFCFPAHPSTQPVRGTNPRAKPSTLSPSEISSPAWQISSHSPVLQGCPTTDALIFPGQLFPHLCSQMPHHDSIAHWASESPLLTHYLTTSPSEAETTPCISKPPWSGSVLGSELDAQ